MCAATCGAGRSAERPKLAAVRPGRRMFCRRSSPWATSRPASSVMSTRHSCWVRPWLRAEAVTFTRPSVTGRRKWVVLVRPTATWPDSRTAALAPTLAALSITVV